jgi:hypothetical protein
MVRVVRVYGCEIEDRAARRLIGQLTKSGTPTAMAAAKVISQGLDKQDSAGKLTPEMRDTILSAINGQNHGLRGLLRVLSSDQRARA